MHSVLIVDDDGAARYSMRRALEESYKIFEAESAAGARRILAAENPDLLLLDIEMRKKPVWTSSALSRRAPIRDP